MRTASTLPLFMWLCQVPALLIVQDTSSLVLSLSLFAAAVVGNGCGHAVAVTNCSCCSCHMLSLPLLTLPVLTQRRIKILSIAVLACFSLLPPCLPHSTASTTSDDSSGDSSDDSTQQQQQQLEGEEGKQDLDQKNGVQKEVAKQDAAKGFPKSSSVELFVANHGGDLPVRKILMNMFSFSRHT